MVQGWIAENELMRGDEVKDMHTRTDGKKQLFCRACGQSVDFCSQRGCKFYGA